VDRATCPVFGLSRVQHRLLPKLILQVPEQVGYDGYAKAMIKIRQYPRLPNAIYPSYKRQSKANQISKYVPHIEDASVAVCEFKDD